MNSEDSTKVDKLPEGEELEEDEVEDEANDEATDEANDEANDNQEPAEEDTLNDFQLLLADAMKDVLSLKLQDKEFDEIILDADKLNQYSPEELYAALGKKYRRMMQIVDEEEEEIEKLVDQNQELKEEMDELVKFSEELAEKVTLTVNGILKSNEKIRSSKKKGGNEAVEKMKKILAEKEEEAYSLQVKQKTVIDKFVFLREKQKEYAARAEESARANLELIEHAKAMQDQLRDSEVGILDKQAELQNLNKQKRIIEEKVKQNQWKLGTMIGVMSRKSAFKSKYFEECKKIHEKYANSERQLQEIAAEKERFEKELAQRKFEILHVYNLNEEYEKKCNNQKTVESFWKFQKSRNARLVAEQNKIKENINEIAPQAKIDLDQLPTHSSKEDISNSQGNQVIAERSEEEEEGASSREGAEELIAKYKKHVEENFKKIEILEKTNEKRAEAIEMQRMILAGLQNKYIDKLQELKSLTADCEKLMIATDGLDGDLEVILRRFQLISEFLRMTNQLLSQAREGDLEDEEEQEPDENEQAEGEEEERHEERNQGEDDDEEAEDMQQQENNEEQEIEGEDEEEGEEEGEEEYEFEENGELNQEPAENEHSGSYQEGQEQ